MTEDSLIQDHKVTLMSLS